MKFEKINENKLKIILNRDELPSSENLDEFMSDTNYARNSFLSILDEAYHKVGFDTNNYKIKIDAKSLIDGSFIFTVTKVVKLVEKPKKVKPHKVYKNKVSSKTIVYSFDRFDDFVKLCKDLKRNNFASFDDVCSNSNFYKSNDTYFLIIENLNQNSNRSSSFLSSITEFGDFVSENKIYAYSLEEHGDLLIKNNALEVGFKL